MDFFQVREASQGKLSRIIPDDPGIHCGVKVTVIRPHLDPAIHAARGAQTMLIPVVRAVGSLFPDPTFEMKKKILK